MKKKEAFQLIVDWADIGMKNEMASDEATKLRDAIDFVARLLDIHPSNITTDAIDSYAYMKMD